jgi:hypothetical protein
MTSPSVVWTAMRGESWLVGELTHFPSKWRVQAGDGCPSDVPQDVPTAVPEPGDTLLHIAIKCDRRDVIEWLSRHRSQLPVQIQNDHGRTAKDCARSLGLDALYGLMEERPERARREERLRHVGSVVGGVVLAVGLVQAAEVAARGRALPAHMFCCCMVVLCVARNLARD